MTCGLPLQLHMVANLKKREKCCGWLSAASDALPRICICNEAVGEYFASTLWSCTKRSALQLQDNHHVTLHDTSNLCCMDYSSRCCSFTQPRHTLEPYVSISGTDEPLLWLTRYDYKRRPSHCNSPPLGKPSRFRLCEHACCSCAC